MLPFDNSVDAVFQPGKSSIYFDGLALNLVPFEPRRVAYSPRNAWWLAELCRVIYRGSSVEGDVVQPDRRTILQNAGLTEVFFESEDTQAALIGAPSFAALIFRGTLGLHDWAINLKADRDPWHDGKGRVHAGFQTSIDRLFRDTDILARLHALKTPLFFAGHSLGAAQAILAAARLASDGVARAVYAYGCPRIGNRTFARNYPAHVHVHRVVNHDDIITTLPPAILGYQHVGEVREIRVAQRKRAPHRPLHQAIDLLHIRDVELPECVADHAPQNYVARLQQLAFE